MVAQWVLGAPARLNATNTTKGGPMEADSPFIPKLTTTDWNAEWVELQRARRAADSAEHGDIGAQISCGACLVGAFAPWDHFHIIA